MRVAGAFLSGIGHAGVIGLAAIGPPFLWAPPDRPVPVMLVSMLTAAELAALVPAPPPPTPSPPKPKPVAPPPMPPPLVLPRMMEPETVPPPVTLAPGFGAGASLGGGEAPTGEGEGAAGFAPGTEAMPEDSEALRVDYMARVQRAVTRARVYPRVARDRGLEGRVVFQLVLSPDGALLAAQLLQSSGAMTLDRAALETVRKAGYPPAPAGFEAERLTVAVEVVFAGSDR